MSTNQPSHVSPANAPATSSRLAPKKAGSTSLCGSPCQKTKVDSRTSSVASAYFNQPGGIRIQVSATSASTASASTSTPGMAMLTGVGLASLIPAAVGPTTATAPRSGGSVPPQTGVASMTSAALA